MTNELMRDYCVREYSSSARKATCNQCRVPHEILDPTMAVRRCVIDVLAIFEADEIGISPERTGFHRPLVNTSTSDASKFSKSPKLIVVKRSCISSFSQGMPKLDKLLFPQARRVLVAAVGGNVEGISQTSQDSPRSFTMGMPSTLFRRQEHENGML